MGILSWDGRGRFWYDSAVPSPHQYAAEKVGFVWDAESLRWYTRNPHKALKLRQWADKSAELKLKNTFITELSPLPECIPYPHHLTPTEFQIESAWWMLSRTPSYCADEQGLGKTIEAVLCMNAVPGKTIIICPPFLKYNWWDEIHKWSTWFDGKALGHVPTVYIVESGTPDRSCLDADIIIMPDSLIDSATLQHYFKTVDATWLFVDEAHRYKTPNTNRTIALIGSDESDKQAAEMGRAEPYFQFTNCAQRVCFLSGTPIPNGKPMELFPLVHRVAPAAIGHATQHEFGIEFCGGRERVRYEGRNARTNWDYSGATNLKRLRRLLREKFLIRHLKKHVLGELQPKQRKLIFLDSPQELLTYEKKLLKNYTLEELLGGQKGWSENRLGDLAKYQREVGEAKLPGATAYIKDLLEGSEEKLVVFVHHIAVGEELRTALDKYGCLLIRGGMDAAKKALFVRSFQNKPNRRVLVMNIDMAVGMTLTQARIGVAVEFSWVPGVNEQAEDRLHRMTQTKDVLMHYLVMRGTLEERKLRRVMEKASNVKRVMG